MYSTRNYEKASIQLKGVDTFSDLILISVTEGREEGLSISQGHEKWWIKSMGDRVQVRRFSGYIPSEYDEKLQYMYLNHWRLSKCLDQGESLGLNYKDRYVRGYMVGLTINYAHNSMPMFSFDFVIIGADSLTDVPIDAENPELNFNRDVNNSPGGKCTIFKSWDDLFEDFILSKMQKKYVEKYKTQSLTGNDFNIISFGAGIRELVLTLIVDEYIDKDNQNGQAKFLREFKDKWKVKNLTTGAVCLSYRERVAMGFIKNISGISSTSKGMALTVTYLVEEETCVIST